MTRREIFIAAHATTRKLVTAGVSYRHTFGLVLKGLLRTPKNRSFDIVETQEHRQRADRSTSFFRGVLRIDGLDVRFSASTRLKDPAGDLLSVKATTLTVAGAHLTSVLSHLDRAKAEEARKTEIVESMVEITGASDRQIAYAVDMRARRHPVLVHNIDLRIRSLTSAGAERHAAEWQHVKACLGRIADAKFWIESAGMEDAHALVMDRFPAHNA